MWADIGAAYYSIFVSLSYKITWTPYFLSIRFSDGGTERRPLEIELENF